jgi:hypothetical protein
MVVLLEQVKSLFVEISIFAWLVETEQKRAAQSTSKQLGWIDVASAHELDQARLN